MPSCRWGGRIPSAQNVHSSGSGVAGTAALPLLSVDVDTAGGFTDFANRKNIELRRGTGEKIAINWFKAVKDPGLDKPVYANDQVLVHKRIW